MSSSWIVLEPNFSAKKEQYYLFLLKRLRGYFYQDRGFVVSPKAILKSPAEVVFPYIEEVVQNNKILKWLNSYEKTQHFPLILSVDEYEKLNFRHLFNQLLREKPVNKKQTEELRAFLTINKSALKRFAANYVQNVNNLKIVVIPVNFGTSKTFIYDVLENSIQLTWRYDLKNWKYYITEGFVSALVATDLRFRDTATVHNKHGWFEREAICDYLTKQLYSKLQITDPIQDVDETVQSLKNAKTLFKYTENSEDYLRSIGIKTTPLLKPTHIKLKQRKLSIGSHSVILTSMEERFMESVLNSFPYASTFDEIAKYMWGDDSDRFSLYTISRTQANIRLKLKTIGHESLLVTLRGKGVLLNDKYY